MQERIYVRDFFQLLVNYKKQIAILTGSAFLTMLSLSMVLPKSYKADFELNIYTKYFKNSLISEVLPGMNSTQEMTQTVDSMVKEVFSDKYIDQLAKKFNFYDASQLSPIELTREREELRWRFDLMGTGAQSYHISFAHKDRMICYEVAKQVMEDVRAAFINSRIETIEIAKKTILKKLEHVNVTKQISDSDISSNALASKDPNVLHSEINKIDQDISSLKLQFNVSHPRVVKLQNRKRTIENWLNELDKNNDSPENKVTIDDFSDAPLLMASNSEIANAISSKLYTKFNDVNIALDIERKSLPSYIGIIEYPQIPTSPLFPKKKLFASIGLILGLIFSFCYIFYKEIMILSPSEKSKELAEQLDTSFFGTLPHIDESALLSGKDIVYSKIPLENKSILKNTES